MPKQWYGPAARAARKRREKELAYTVAAMREADGLGHPYVGAEHLLLALVRPDETTVAARALRESGVDYDPLRGVLGENGARRRRPPRAQKLPPLFHTLRARADGLAVAFGAKQVGAEHLLLAILWEAHETTTGHLERLGTSPRAVQRTLAELGATVPPGSPPARDDTRWGEDVTVRIPGGDAWELASRVRELLPEGAPIAFNFNSTSAWYRSGEGIDLAPIVRKARRQQLADRRRAPRDEPQPPRAVRR
jgi:ATP-dependent Clp protease ATP-binding subunit ClpA